MNVAQLQRVLTEADPAAVLVSPRVLEKVVIQTQKLRGIYWNTPHADCAVVERHVLFRHVEQEDLTLQSHQLLPARVILLPRPKTEELGSKNAGQLLLKYWRLLFHGNIHMILDDRRRQGLLVESAIRARIDIVGRTEFEEIRSVLERDGCLPHPDDDCAVFVEFTALFLELRQFAPDLLPIYFPSLRDFEGVGDLLESDLDAEALFERTRLAEAPSPAPQSRDKEFESHEYYWKLTRNADRIAETGNLVKAAILHTRAARVAPAILTPATIAKAEADLRQLTQRLQEPLNLSEEKCEALLPDLLKLLDKADQGHHPIEARFLYELQRVCIDHEEAIYALGPVEWLMSFGKRPIKRPLPSQRLVRILRDLRSAIGRLTFARLADDDREHLTELLKDALTDAEERLREQFRPIIAASLEDVGLRAISAPEQTAQQKMIEELLDRVIEAGFITFSDLRDIISRNQLKMPDLHDPQDFIHGDPLLRLDRRFATVLDGVYRASEVYTRWLERSTSIMFGTPVGRALTKYAVVPFGTAFVVCETVKIIIASFLGNHHAVGEEEIHPVLQWFAIDDWPFWSIVLCVGLVILAFLHSRRLRRYLATAGEIAFKGMRQLFLELPIRIVTAKELRKVARSWPAQLTYWYGVRPALGTVLFWLIFRSFLPTIFHIGGVFIALMLFLNTRTGLAMTRLMYQGFLDLVVLVRAGLLGGMYSLVVAIFKQVTHLVEYLLFKVDELLRFRGDEGPVSFAARIVVSTIWYPISFVTRFYIIVLIEPMINPLKIPISAVAGKILWGPFVILAPYLIDELTPFLGPVLAPAFVSINLFLLPDAFGFLIWETKENWSLYRANRTRAVQAVPIGSHGETVRSLLAPGLHSGTVPMLFARLRQAERQALATGDYRKSRACRRSMEEVKERIHRFVVRELISLVHRSEGWSQRPLSVQSVRLASNCIDVYLAHTEYPGEVLHWRWEWRQPWLIAEIRSPAWLEELSPERRAAFLAGLTWLYKLAGVGLVTEQLQSALPADVASIDVTAKGLTVWLDRRYGKSVQYDLKWNASRFRPRSDTLDALDAFPTYKPEDIVFRRRELSWDDLTEAWRKQGEAYRELALVQIYAEGKHESSVTAEQERQTA